MSRSTGGHPDSRLPGTAEYKLRSKVRYLMKKGRFSEGERKRLTQLFARSASAGRTVMPTIGRRAEQAPSACSRPGCGNDAASPRAKLCMACFKAIASLANAQRKARRGGGGVPGNRGNSGGKGAPGNRGGEGVPGNRGNNGGQGELGNRGNATAGRKKELAGQRSTKVSAL